MTLGGLATWMVMGGIGAGENVSWLFSMHIDGMTTEAFSPNHLLLISAFPSLPRPPLTQSAFPILQALRLGIPQSLIILLPKRGQTSIRAICRQTFSNPTSIPRPRTQIPTSSCHLQPDGLFIGKIGMIMTSMGCTPGRPGWQR